MTFAEIIAKEILTDGTGSCLGGKSWNIGFTNSDGNDDETQFDLDEGETADDLEALWEGFVKENPGTRADSILYIEQEENPA